MSQMRMKKPKDAEDCARLYSATYADLVQARLQLKWKEEEIKALKAHDSIVTAGLSEIHATLEGRSTQPIPDIIRGVIAEIRKQTA